MNASPDKRTSAATALAAFVFLGALAGLSILLVQPPRAVPESAPPSEFSSARAMRHVRAVLDGKALVGESATTGGVVDILRVSYTAPPPEGLELTLETRANAPLSLVAQDLSFGLPELQGRVIRARPDDTTPVPSNRTSDMTIIRHSVELGSLQTDPPTSVLLNKKE